MHAPTCQANSGQPASGRDSIGSGREGNARLDSVLNLPYKRRSRSAQVAQLVEQRTENPCVGGSIPPLGTTDVSGSYATLSSASAAAGDAAQFALSPKTVWARWPRWA